MELKQLKTRARLADRALRVLRDEVLMFYREIDHARGHRSISTRRVEEVLIAGGYLRRARS